MVTGGCLIWHHMDCGMITGHTYPLETLMLDLFDTEWANLSSAETQLSENVYFSYGSIAQYNATIF